MIVDSAFYDTFSLQETTEKYVLKESESCTELLKALKVESIGNKAKKDIDSKVCSKII